MVSEYLHGFSPKEQERLVDQAKFLAPHAYRQVDFSKSHEIVELGCGVGAQTDLLLEKFPQLFINAVDASSEQIDLAQKRHAQNILQKKVKFHLTSAAQVPLTDASQDGAFICWLLEHVTKPMAILKEAKRVLKPGSPIFINEVFNQTFFVEPYSPHILQYWFTYNDQQWNMQGDPFVGIKLANFLINSGFQKIESEVVFLQYDQRKPQEKLTFIDYMIRLMESGSAQLIQNNRITPAQWEQTKLEMEQLKTNPSSVITLGWVFAKALA